MSNQQLALVVTVPTPKLAIRFSVKATFESSRGYITDGKYGGKRSKNLLIYTFFCKFNKSKARLSKRGCRCLGQSAGTAGGPASSTLSGLLLCLLRRGPRRTLPALCVLRVSVLLHSAHSCVCAHSSHKVGACSFHRVSCGFQKLLFCVCAGVGGYEVLFVTKGLSDMLRKQHTCVCIHMRRLFVHAFNMPCVPWTLYWFMPF